MSENEKENEPQIDPSKIIYYMDEGQKTSLEKDINVSLVELEKLFQKEDILKFLYKFIEEGKIDFSKEIKKEKKEVTEEEISEKKDNLCRELKKLFDSINPEIFPKYNRRIAAAAINIMKEIYKRKIIVNNKIRDIKVKVINKDFQDKKMIYEKLEEIKALIQETIYISSNYISELNNANGYLLENLDEFYNEKNNIEFVNNINGEEKRAKEDDLIQKVVNMKENKGKEFIIETKKFINEKIEEQYNLDKRLNNVIDELENLKEQKNIFVKYYNDNSDFKDINNMDFY